MTKRNSNRYFIGGTIFACLLIICLLLLFLDKKQPATEFTIPNITTIVGTVLTIGALAFTIREQMKIKSISDAISKNNQNIKKELLKHSYDSNLGRCSRFVRDIENHIKSDDASSVLIRLSDLRECLIDCKKLISTGQSASSFKCLSNLLEKEDKELTKKNIKSIWENVTLQEDSKMQSILNSNVAKLSNYIIAIEVTNYSLNGIKNKDEFISYINELGNYLNEINDLNIFKIEKND